MKLTRSSLKKPQTSTEEERIIVPPLCEKHKKEKCVYVRTYNGKTVRKCATFRRCFPPLPSSRVFLAPGCIHPLEGTGFGVFALRVMDERSRSRWAWWSRSQRSVTHRAHAVRARARERESMTHVLCTRTGRNSARASLFSPIVLSRSNVCPATRDREDSFDSRSSLDTVESDDSKLGSFPPWRPTRWTNLGDPFGSRRARFFTVFEFRFQ